MKTPPVTTRTREQITAAFDAVFKDVVPPEPVRPPTMAERLAPYRSVILRQRRRGLTWQQIAEGMRDPRIGETVSEKALRSFFPRKRAADSSRSRVTRLMLDPVTGRPVPVPGLPASRPPMPTPAPRL